MLATFLSPVMLIPTIELRTYFASRRTWKKTRAWSDSLSNVSLSDRERPACQLTPRVVVIIFTTLWSKCRHLTRKLVDIIQWDCSPSSTQNWSQLFLCALLRFSVTSVQSKDVLSYAVVFCILRCRYIRPPCVSPRRVMWSAISDHTPSDHTTPATLLPSLWFRPLGAKLDKYFSGLCKINQQIR